MNIIRCATKSDNFLFIKNIYPRKDHLSNTQISIHENPSRIMFNSTSVRIMITGSSIMIIGSEIFQYHDLGIVKKVTIAGVMITRS